MNNQPLNWSDKNGRLAARSHGFTYVINPQHAWAIEWLGGHSTHGLNGLDKTELEALKSLCEQHHQTVCVSAECAAQTPPKKLLGVDELLSQGIRFVRNHPCLAKEILACLVQSVSSKDGLWFGTGWHAIDDKMRLAEWSADGKTWHSFEIQESEAA